MHKNFLEILKSEGILADGAIGTEIYRRGIFINRCYDELNLSSPKLIEKIHTDYVKAGAGLVKTNTFTANRGALLSYGLETKTAEINKAGVELAKNAAGENVFVAGSIGPVSTGTSKGYCEEEWGELFAEQVKALSGADLILFETFTNLNEIEIAIKAAKKVSKLPVVAQVSIKRMNDEDEYIGFTPEEAVRRMSAAGADVTGVNCSDGPQGVFETVKRMIAVSDRPVSAMPNAGMPKIVQGRMLYLATPEYMAEYARRFAQLGVALIGGCCGTTPEHIKEMKKYLKPLRPGLHTEVKEHAEIIREEKRGIEPKPLEKRSPFGAVLGKKFTISVEVDPPMGINTKEAVEGSRLLKELGVDAVNIADGPRAVPRMSPMALASIIKDKVGIETIVHYCCRDRNILGIQMDLLGAAALGLNNMLIITGDPPKMGYYPDATAVFDIDSVGLIRFAANLNRALDFASRPIKEATSLVIGCGVNPGAVDADIEAERYRLKVEAGAEYVFSQPIYDMKILDRFLDKIKGVKKIPFFVGILPLTSLKNAEFLHNEVPGMQVPQKIMDMLKKESSKEGQQRVGLEVAKEILSYAKKDSRLGGAYIFPPFGKYRLIEELLR